MTSCWPDRDHWRKLPQVSFLCHDKSFVFVTTNTCLSQRNTSSTVTKVCLLQQNFCRSKIMFVCDKIFLLQQKFCHNKVCLSRQIFVVTIFFGHDKSFVCCDKRSVTTSILLSWQTRVCRNKTSVTTKIILVAAPAKDRQKNAFERHLKKADKANNRSWVICWTLGSNFDHVLTQLWNSLQEEVQSVLNPREKTINHTTPTK